MSTWLVMAECLAMFRVDASDELEAMRKAEEYADEMPIKAGEGISFLGLVIGGQETCVFPNKEGVDESVRG